ncbi:MAG TPA: hypothetical protein VFO16_00325 [Pseudonocardiaceae bacterium]|nr:hypothetical protein [Pseudonocardiaceae bacterium]
MDLITSEQRDELITTLVERDAFHLELRDTYAAATGDNPFAKWLRGEPDDFMWFQPWQARIRNATQVGKVVRRVRIISEPITDYIRWEHSNTTRNLEVGEDIRWLPRHLVPRDVVFPVGGNDWWLFDGRLVAVGHFNDDGIVRGHEIIDDRAVVAECVRVRDQLWAIAIPHIGYQPV